MKLRVSAFNKKKQDGRVIDYSRWGRIEWMFWGCRAKKIQV